MFVLKVLNLDNDFEWIEDGLIIEVLEDDILFVVCLNLLGNSGINIIGK